jgi:putative phosphoesterase
MTLLILSDSHGNHAAVQRIIKKHEAEIAAVLHLGDHDYDLLRFEGETALPLYAVAGNCDEGSASPVKRVVEFGGVKIFMSHGNKMQLHSGLTRLMLHTQEAEARVCLFGHTHQSIICEHSNIFFVNPGSLQSPRDNKPPSYALLHIRNGIISADIIHLGEIKKVQA